MHSRAADLTPDLLRRLIADGQSTARTAQAPGWPNDGRGSATSAGVGGFASARAGASEGATVNRALPRCRSVTSQLTVSRTNKVRSPRLKHYGLCRCWNRATSVSAPGRCGPLPGQHQVADVRCGWVCR